MTPDLESLEAKVRNAEMFRRITAEEILALIAEVRRLREVEKAAIALRESMTHTPKGCFADKEKCHSLNVALCQAKERP